MEVTVEDSRQSPLTHRQWLLLGLIVLVAVALRCWSVWATGGYLDRDCYMYFRQAQDLLSGNVWNWVAVHRKPPLFSALLAGGAAMGFTFQATGFFVSAVAGTLLLHPAWLLLRRCGQASTALAGLAILAVMKEPVLLSGRCLGDAAYAAMSLYAIYFLLVRGLMDRSLWGFAVAGLLTGLTAWTRSEGLAMTALGALLILAAAVRRKLPWRRAIAGCALFVLAAVAVEAPYIAAMSIQEGKLTFRRNVENFMAYSLGAAEGKEGGGSVLQTLASHPLTVLLRWLGNLAKYLYDVLPAMGGYFTGVLLALGLVRDRRQLWRWGPWQLGLLYFALMLLAISVFEPHGRYLSALVCLTLWPMARGAEAVAAWLCASRKIAAADGRAVRAATVACAIAVVIVGAISAGALARHNRHEEADLPVAGNVVRRDVMLRDMARSVVKPSAGELRVMTSEPMVAWYAGGVWIDFRLGKDKTVTPAELGDWLSRERAEYLVVRPSNLKELCPQFDPQRPPPFLKQLPGISNADDAKHQNDAMLVFRCVEGRP